MINYKTVQQLKTLVKLGSINVEMEQNVLQNQKHQQLWCHTGISHHLLQPIYTIANVHPSLKENFVTKDVRLPYFSYFDNNQENLSEIRMSNNYFFVCEISLSGRPPQSQRDRARKGKKNKRKGASRRGRGKKCRKQRYRDYYIEPNGCRSKKSFKMVRRHSNIF